MTHTPAHDPFHRVAVVGLGYIGLPTAAMFARSGKEVIGIDVNPHTVATINAGRVHIVEPDLDAAIAEAVSAGRLRATTKAEPADAFMIAVPTPFIEEDRRPDLSYIEAAAASIAPVLKPGDLVVLESTSPVGATDRMAGWLADSRPDLSFPHQAGEDADISVAHCPERVLPGRVMHELIHNDRLIGGMTARCTSRARALYNAFVLGACVQTDARTAEMAKLTENSFRDVNIAFANELSLICAHIGVDVWELIALANRHPRVNILQPGPGVGGHCIAVDPWFIVDSAPAQARLIRTAREVNDSKPQWVIDQVAAAVERARANGSDEPAVVCWGLSFKPDIDDLRESPALAICAQLGARYPGRVFAIEPHVDALPSALAGVQLVTQNDVAGAQVHVLLVDHRRFREAPVPAGEIVDTRGLWREGHLSRRE